jgi:predicted phage baseplate assembly protein
MTEETFLRIEFGDGTRGRRLPSGANNVRARYRLGTGLAGNLPAGRLEKPARPHPLVDKVRQPSPSSGGGDMESASALKRNAPASVLTLERAVSADDYAHLATAHAAVWRARAFALPSALRRPRVEVVIVPAGGGALDERLAAALQSFLLAHSLPGIHIVLSEFGRVWLHLDITLRIVSAEYDPQVVKAQAIARLTGAFALQQRNIGTPLYLSDVYAVIETIPGVRNSSCSLAWDRGGERQPAAQRADAGAREVVFLDPVARPGALRIEFEEFEL